MAEVRGRFTPIRQSSGVRNSILIDSTCSFRSRIGAWEPVTRSAFGPIQAILIGCCSAPTSKTLPGSLRRGWGMANTEISVLDCVGSLQRRSNTNAICAPSGDGRPIVATLTQWVRAHPGDASAVSTESAVRGPTRHSWRCRLWVDRGCASLIALGLTIAGIVE